MRPEVSACGEQEAVVSAAAPAQAPAAILAIAVLRSNVACVKGLWGIRTLGTHGGEKGAEEGVSTIGCRDSEGARPGTQGMRSISGSLGDHMASMKLLPVVRSKSFSADLIST